MVKKSLIMMALVLFGLGVMAQTVEEAGAKYNEGIELVKAENYEGAVPVFESALEMAKAAGQDAADLKGNIEKQLSNAYYKGGVALYKAKKISASIALLEKGYAFGKSTGDQDLMEKTASLVSQLRSKVGDSMRKKNQLDDAYAEYEMALEINPTCAKALYGEGLVFKEKNQLDKMTEKMDQVIALEGGSDKMKKMADAARKTTANAWMAAGAEELQNGNASKAIKYINDSFGYEAGDANSYYYLQLAYNMTKDWDQALVSGQKALELKTDDKSDIYFAMGKANEGKGDAAAACEAYKQVSSGPNVDAAKYQMTQVLKCN